MLPSEPWLGPLPIIFAASPDVRAHYVSRYLCGELIPAFALSEPEAGSDVSAITTPTRRDCSHYVLNGRKTWTSNAGLADPYVVFARLETSEAAEGISAFAVERDDRGIFLEERLNLLPPHTVGTWRLLLKRSEYLLPNRAENSAKAAPGGSSRCCRGGRRTAGVSHLC
jgi:acyl-CoA dehydrogenase